LIPSRIKSRTEVQQESESHVRQAKIGKELLLVNGRDGIDRFHLHDEAVLNDQVDTKATLEVDLFVHDREGLLRAER